VLLVEVADRFPLRRRTQLAAPSPIAPVADWAVRVNQVVPISLKLL
jgi:hypothetical protein